MTNPAIVASVHQKLLNLRDKTGEPFNNIIVRYGLERLLYRLEASGGISYFVLKGAMLFTLWPAVPRRSTRDMDFLGLGISTHDQLKKIFINACNVQYGNDGFQFSPESIVTEDIREDQEYHGIRVKLTGYLGRTKIPIQIDVGFGDTVIPEPQFVEYPKILDFPSAKIRAYRPETVIAEKFNALVVLGYRNSRMKDFYDMYILLKNLEIPENELFAAIKGTFERRKTVLSYNPVAFTPAFLEDGAKQIQWKAYIRRNLLDPSLELSEVLKYIHDRILPIIQRTVPR